jgi:MoxR-like ATPase
MEDGQTVVIGGVYEFQDRSDLSKVPFLADRPRCFGNLFKKRGRTKSKAELLIFVTPKVVAGRPALIGAKQRRLKGPRAPSRFATIHEQSHAALNQHARRRSNCAPDPSLRSFHLIRARRIVPPVRCLCRACAKALSAEIVGQAALIEALADCAACRRPPAGGRRAGPAKTTAVRALAARWKPTSPVSSSRRTCCLPTSTGTEVWRPQDGRFEFQPGPIFHPVLLADEINRAPAKVQSALLEAMGERRSRSAAHLSAAGALPGHGDAESDRAGRHVSAAEAQARSLPPCMCASAIPRPRLNRNPAPRPRTRARGHPVRPFARADAHAAGDVFARGAAVLDLHVAPAARALSRSNSVLASRDAPATTATCRRIAWGASPRGFHRAWSAAHVRDAWLAGRDFVTPEDVRAIAPDVLRHRVLPSYEATAEGWDGERLAPRCWTRCRCLSRVDTMPIRQPSTASSPRWPELVGFATPRFWRQTAARQAAATASAACLVALCAVRGMDMPNPANMRSAMMRATSTGG